jgi:hypothetical protein
MITPHGISDLRILGSKLQRRFLALPLRDTRGGGRLLKRKARAVPGLEALEDRMMLATFLVTSTSDNPNVQNGTLRWAINQVDQSTDLSNVIDFDFASVAPGASHTITLSSVLPPITEPVDIDGSSQPGFSGVPLVVIMGTSGGYDVNGHYGLELIAGSSGSIIQNLAIEGCGKGYGIDIFSSNNSVIGCVIGTDIADDEADANLGGVGIEANSLGNTIGGTAAGTANVISGNAGDGIYIDASCLVLGNLIGTNATGAAAVPNIEGIFVDGSGSNPNGSSSDREEQGVTIGGTMASAANVISGNGDTGIYTEAPCLVEGNRIGTNLTGTSALRNTLYGIYVGGSDATIGGTSAGAANVISGNGDLGIFIDAPCLLEGNRIGANADGTGSVPNSDDGIYVEVPGATIGGTSAGAANVISGNSFAGIENVAPALIEGNFIGTNLTGTGAVPNSSVGILVAGNAGGTTIGGTTVGTANVISGNGGDGIDLGASSLVEGNRIGTDLTGANPVPNQGIGVYHDEGPAATDTEGNIIAFNDGPGVATAPGTTGSTIRFNAIFGNSGPGIDLNDDGVTPNTSDGSNNTPVLTSAVGGIVSGTSNASPNSTYIIDIYANLSSDGSASRPQGRDYLITTTVETNAAGDAVFNDPYTPMPGLPILTATTTDAGGTTSEFSSPVHEVTSLGGVLTTFAHTVEFVAGTPYSRVVAGFTDTDPRAFPGQFTAMIDWGDSTADTVGVVSADGAGFDVTGSHAYNVAKTDQIIVTITDAVTGATITANSTAVVDPVPITIQTKNFAVTGGAQFSGTVATFTDGDPRISSGFYTATINWGDNTPTTTGTITGTNPFTVTASHTFATFANTDIVTITITDKNGRTATGVDRVVDPPVAAGPVSATPTSSTTPPAPTPTAAVLAVVADSLALSPNKPFDGAVATFTDTGPAEAASAYTATINWGKGRKSAGMILGSNGRFVVSARHVFARFAGAKTVTVTVTDAEGHVVSVSASASFAVRRPKATKQAKSAARQHR